MFSFNLSEELKLKIQVLLKKDKKTVKIINKKIKEIISCNIYTINHYKNLRYNLKEYKRVHIGKSFVLTFKVDIKNKHIIFADFSHHDDVYRR